jgi:hypothetical protein
MRLRSSTMKKPLDFDTPNAPPRHVQRHPPGPLKKAGPICPFCFQSGSHQSALHCLRALERAVINSPPRVRGKPD